MYSIGNIILNSYYLSHSLNGVIKSDKLDRKIFKTLREAKEVLLKISQAEDPILSKSHGVINNRRWCILPEVERGLFMVCCATASNRIEVLDTEGNRIPRIINTLAEAKALLKPASNRFCFDILHYNLLDGRAGAWENYRSSVVLPVVVPYFDTPTEFNHVNSLRDSYEESRQ